MENSARVALFGTLVFLEFNYNINLKNSDEQLFEYNPCTIICSCFRRYIN